MGRASIIWHYYCLPRGISEQVMIFRHHGIEWALSGLTLDGTCHITTALEPAARFACCASVPATKVLASLCHDQAFSNLIVFLRRVSQQGT